jgi:hypothetical protein
MMRGRVFFQPLKDGLGSPVADREEGADLSDIVFAVVTLSKEGEYPQVVPIDV